MQRRGVAQLRRSQPHMALSRKRGEENVTCCPICKRQLDDNEWHECKAEINNLSIRLSDIVSWNTSLGELRKDLFHL